MSGNREKDIASKNLENRQQRPLILASILLFLAYFFVLLFDNESFYRAFGEIARIDSAAFESLAPALPRQYAELVENGDGAIAERFSAFMLLSIAPVLLVLLYYAFANLEFSARQKRTPIPTILGCILGLFVFCALLYLVVGHLDGAGYEEVRSRKRRFYHPRLPDGPLFFVRSTFLIWSFMLFAYAAILLIKLYRFLDRQPAKSASREDRWRW